MKLTRGHQIQITSLTELDQRMAQGVADLAGWCLVDLDLTERGDRLRRCDLVGALFLGCTLTPEDEQGLRAGGAVIFPDLPGIPVDTYRGSLYAADDLFDTADYAHSLDARAYAWLQSGGDADDALARALHDHAIDTALTSWISGRRIAGVMGGHALVRGSQDYADAARLGSLLGKHLTVATGGGPGAMEAANLGAAMANQPAAVLDEALDRLGAVPSFRPSIDAWVGAATNVLTELRGLGAVNDNLGIPTWHYGHEPPNPFATAIAKYFRNATREAILLQVCDAGIVFLPGAAGTVQEVFQDACENYYADPSSIAPMVLVGREYWTETVPAWPLLEALAGERDMAAHIHLVDSVHEVPAVLLT